METALRLADGIVVLEFVDRDEHAHDRERRFSERLACPNAHPLDIDDLEPRSFSFNSPYGACPECTGLGIRKEVDPELVVPDPELSLADGAIAPWSMGQTSEYFTRLLTGLAEILGFSMDTPWQDLPAKARKAVLEGSSDQVHVRYKNRYGRVRSYYADFEGVMPFLQRRMENTESEQMKERYDGYMRDVPCPACCRHPAAARDPVGHHRLAATTRSPSPRSATCPSPSAPPSSTASPSAAGRRRSPGRCSRRCRHASGSCSTSDSSTCRCRARRVPCPAAKRSGSGSPPRSVPGSSACSTSSTSRRSVCTSETTGV